MPRHGIGLLYTHFILWDVDSRKADKKVAVGITKVKSRRRVDVFYTGAETRWTAAISNKCSRTDDASGFFFSLCVSDIYNLQCVHTQASSGREWGYSCERWPERSRSAREKYMKCENSQRERTWRGKRASARSKSPHLSHMMMRNTLSRLYWLTLIHNATFTHTHTHDIAHIHHTCGTHRPWWGHRWIDPHWFYCMTCTVEPTDPLSKSFMLNLPYRQFTNAMNKQRLNPFAPHAQTHSVNPLPTTRISPGWPHWVLWGCSYV